MPDMLGLNILAQTVGGRDALAKWCDRAKVG